MVTFPFPDKNVILLNKQLYICTCLVLKKYKVFGLTIILYLLSYGQHNVNSKCMTLFLAQLCNFWSIFQFQECKRRSVFTNDNQMSKIEQLVGHRNMTKFCMEMPGKTCDSCDKLWEDPGCGSKTSCLTLCHDFKRQNKNFCQWDK